MVICRDLHLDIWEKEQQAAKTVDLQEEIERYVGYDVSSLYCAAILHDDDKDVYHYYV